MEFMPQEKNIKKLQETIKLYETNEKWQLFLWKEEDDIVGIIGIAIEDDKTAILQHVSVNPSHRNQGLGKTMLIALKQSIGEQFTILPNKHTRSFFEKCFANHEKEEL